MKTDLWSLKTGLSLFAVVVLAIVWFEHVRGVEFDSRSGHSAASRAGDDADEDEDDEEDDFNSACMVADSDVAKSAESDSLVSAGPMNGGTEAAIRKTADAFTAAFDRGDAAAIAALWTVDGEYVDSTGKHVVGRDAIKQQYAQFFAEKPGAKIEIAIDAIRPIAADAAIEDGHATLLPRVPGVPSSPYTVIHTKVDGHWLMASVREPRVEPPAGNDPLGSLNWLVGSWRAEQDGATMDVTFRWIANQNFLERIYTVEQGGRITASGVQLIGQDPASRELQSWNFAAGAGYAVGDWIRRPDGWQIVIRGKLPDGTTTSAVNYLTRFDENTLSWQSRERKAGETSLPDTAVVKLTRVAGSR